MMMESTTAIRKDNDFPNVNINGDSDTRTRIAGAANMAIVNKRAVAFLFFRAERRWCLYWPIWPVFLGGEGKKQLQVDFRCTPRVINERRAIYSTCEHQKIKNFTSWIRCFNDSKDLLHHDPLISPILFTGRLLLCLLPSQSLLSTSCLPCRVFARTCGRDSRSETMGIIWDIR